MNLYIGREPREPTPFSLDAPDMAVSYQAIAGMAAEMAYLHDELSLQQAWVSQEELPLLFARNEQVIRTLGSSVLSMKRFTGSIEADAVRSILEQD